MSRQATLTKQALERWRTLPFSEQKKLLEELTSFAPGSAMIELDEIQDVWHNGEYKGAISKARIVSIVFGMDVTQHRKRYLFASDIPK